MYFPLQAAQSFSILRELGDRTKIVKWAASPIDVAADTFRASSPVMSIEEKADQQELTHFFLNTHRIDDSFKILVCFG